MIRAHLSEKAENVKTGPIPVSTTCRASCPPSCPFRGKNAGCYAQNSFLGMMWNAVDRGTLGGPWPEFCRKVAAMPENQLWRHNQAGDLPGRGGVIDRKALSALVEANRGKRGFTYTHYDPRKAGNAEAIREANRNGFTVNLSGDCLAHADRLAELGVGPVVCVLPARSEGREFRTPEGRRVVTCPAERVEYMTCSVCKRCQDAGRKRIVGFRAHGSCRLNIDRKYARLTAKHRRVNRAAVVQAVESGAAGVLGVMRALGYSSTCGQTIRKVRAACPDLDALLAARRGVPAGAQE